MSAKQWLLSTAALAGLGLAPVAAAAQNAPAPAGVVTPASTASGKLEEVVVTAERRASSAQKTPVSIEVFTAATLSKQGVHDVAALSAIAPSLNFNESAGLPTIGIRGITSNDVTETGDLAVLVANNGFFNSRAYALREGFYDVSRVEVLEGPQGTLFGRNAAGGVVNIIDNTPVDHYAGYASVQYGNYNDIETEGMANIPISPSLSARFSFLTQNHDGYIDEHLAGTYGQTQRGDDADNQSGRVVLQYHPSEDFNGVITMQYSKVGGIGDVRDEIPLTYDNSGACPGSASNNGCVVVNKMPVGVYKNGDTITANAPASQNATDKLLIWNLAYSALPYGITASYIGGFDHIDNMIANDTTNNYGYDEGGNVVAKPANPDPLDYFQNEHPTTMNQEFRLTSPSGGPLTWQTGIFYFLEQSHVDSYQQYVGGSSTGALAARFDEKTVSASSIAGYGQASYAVTPELKLTFGMRYTDDRKYRKDSTFALYPDTIFGPGGGGLPSNKPFLLAPYNGSSASTRTTYHAAIDWTPTPRSLIYAKFDTGYKAGGYDSAPIFFPTPGVIDVPYAPETIDAYEIGTKNTFLDHHLLFNLTGYHYDYHNLQTTLFTTALTGSVTVNAKSATINGGEAQSVVSLDGIGRFDIDLDYTDATYSNFLTSPTFPVDPATNPNCSGVLGQQKCQLKGNSLPDVAKWSVSLAFEHIWENAIAGGSLTFDVRTLIKTTQYLEPFNEAAARRSCPRAWCRSCG